MAVRVRHFTRAHPSEDSTYLKVVAALEERLARADTLAIQQRDGTLEQHGSIVRRQELRRLMQGELLPQLVRAGERAVSQRPELTGFFRLPLPNGPNKVFLTAAQAMYAKAVETKDLLVDLGMSAAMLDELGRSVAEFEKVTEAAHEGRRDHVGASADLKVVTDEIVGLVALLDGLNRFRFRDDAEVLAAWQSAADIVGPFRSKPAEPGAESTTGAAGPPADGAVAA